jgi:hypothetical protein
MRATDRATAGRRASDGRGVNGRRIERRRGQIERGRRQIDRSRSRVGSCASWVGSRRARVGSTGRGIGSSGRRGGSSASASASERFLQHPPSSRASRFLFSQKSAPRTPL